MIFIDIIAAIVLLFFTPVAWLIPAAIVYVVARVILGSTFKGAKAALEKSKPTIDKGIEGVSERAKRGARQMDTVGNLWIEKHGPGLQKGFKDGLGVLREAFLVVLSVAFVSLRKVYNKVFVERKKRAFEDSGAGSE